MIYFFLSDEAFAVTEAKASVMSIDTVQLYKLGVLDDNLLNYFSKHTVVVDPVGILSNGNRKRRLPNAENIIDEYTRILDGNGIALSTIPTGRVMLNFDSAVLSETDKAAIDALTILDGDSQNTVNDKILKRGALFNIIETIFFARDSNGLCKPAEIPNSNNYDRESIDSILAPNGVTVNPTYTGYVPKSLACSVTVTDAVYRVVDAERTVSEKTSSELHFYDYITFKFKYGSEPADVVDIKVWLSTESFKANYPYSFITDIIYPCKPEWILRPSNYGSEVIAILESSDYKDRILDTAVSEKDHSGIAIYKSRYTPEGISRNIQMGFAVMYKGAAPSSMAMRNAIRSKLLSEKNPNTGTYFDHSGEKWKKVLPDLFIDAGFYIFPCYFQRATYGNRTIERSIVNYKKIFDCVRSFFTSNEFSDADLYRYMELIQAPGHGMYLAVFPTSISSGYTSLLNIHPTYQPLDSVGTITSFETTTDTVFLENKNYFYHSTVNPYEFVQLIEGESGDYRNGDSVLTISGTIGSPIYERIYQTNQDDWNSMTSSSRILAYYLSRCIASCIAPTVDNTSFLTEEYLGAQTPKQFYSFIVNSIEFHVMTLSGASGIFTGD